MWGSTRKASQAREPQPGTPAFQEVLRAQEVALGLRADPDVARRAAEADAARHQAERRLMQAWDAWERAEATAREQIAAEGKDPRFVTRPDENAAASAARVAHDAYAALMPPTRDLTADELAAQLAEDAACEARTHGEAGAA